MSEEDWPQNRLSRKDAGAYYTPDPVVGSLVSWAVRTEEDRLLDPSCGDGRFIASHRNSVGIEQDAAATATAMERAPWALVHEGDFFSWAGETTELFDCAAGNPPFIRYQRFKDDVRARALALCTALGANFTGLASSWAPFVVATAGLLKRGGRMAFVVPAEIGHAPYSAPVLEYLTSNFSLVHIIAVRDKLFPDLSEDCWLLFVDGKGAGTKEIRFSALERFAPCKVPPKKFVRVSVKDWREVWGRRLRPYLLSDAAREQYQLIEARSDTKTFGELASIGIGYVSGANDFFHLRPSDAKRWRIPTKLLHPAVRNGRALPPSRLTQSVVERWVREDAAVMLLRLSKSGELPISVQEYLRTDAARSAREAYKCRVRDPWYSVPDVQTPDFFLSYMSGLTPSLVRNDAGCTCTNSVHAVRLKSRAALDSHLRSWSSPFVQLSCELEGHPLGGGMLKLEPREATAVLLPCHQIMRAHRQDALIAAKATSLASTTGRVVGQNDIAIQKSGEPVEAVVRFHNALRELTGRRGIRDDVSRYEAVAMALVDPVGSKPGNVLDSYPKNDSALRIERFFDTLYLRYDERYVYSAPDLKAETRRREWSPSSPLFDEAKVAQLPPLSLDYVPRIAAGDEEE